MTPIVLTAVGIALGVGLLTGGSVDNLLEARFRWLPILILIVFIQIDVWILSHITDSPALKWVHLATFAGTGLWLLYNVVAQPSRGLRVALGAITIGWSLNAFVMFLNGGMPVVLHSDDPGAEISVEAQLEHVQSYRTVELDENTLFPWLADTIEVPYSTQIISPGDALLTAGIAFFVGVGTHATRRQEVATDKYSAADHT